jgi:LuxR family maltose regulon positive regulatory protein
MMVVSSMELGPTPVASAPAAPRGVVARPELHALMTGSARVTQLTGPAGGGKTFLLRSWVAHAGVEREVAWVTVPRGLGDAQQFWLSVNRALRATPAASCVRELTPTTEFDAEEVVDRLLQDLEALPSPVWLVIDDLYELSSPEAVAGLRRLIHDGPQRLRFVFATRAPVALDLHRLRLEGELNEIRGADLRFSPAEARALLHAAGVELSDTALQALVDRTQGWAAGLRLAALSLARHPDPEQLAAEFSGNEQTVAEYLVAEVLQRLPDDVTQLLLRTSILDRVSGPLADRLTGGSGAERVLAGMEEAGAFVVSLDAERSWFRYHPLFADLLARELRRTAPQELEPLHATAAAWLAEHDEPLEAIRHAQAIPDWPLASRLLSEHWFALLLDGRRDTVRELLGRFPEEMVTSHAELSVVAAGIEFIGGSLEDGERFVALAERNLETMDPAMPPRLRTELTALKLGLARARNDLTTVSIEAMRLLRPFDETLMPSEELRIFALSNIGAAELSLARFDDADQHLEHAVELAHRSRRPLPETFALANWAQLASFLSAPDAERRSREAIAISEAHGWENGKAVGIAATVLGTVMLWRGRLDDAQQWLGRARAALPTDSEPATGTMLLAAEAMLSYVRGDRRTASEAATAAEHLGDLLIGSHVVATRARVHLLMTLVRLGEAERARASWSRLTAAPPEPGTEGRHSLAGAIVQATTRRRPPRGWRERCGARSTRASMTSGRRRSCCWRRSRAT